MPDIWTHILCGQDVVASMTEGNWKEILKSREKIFNLGCQGPDIFLYNDFWPWIKEKRGPNIGRTMHLEKTGDFFIEGTKYLKNMQDKKKDIIDLFVYICGFACHFALDRNAHPYVHYYAGKYDKNRKDTVKYKGYHKRLELMIDTILIMERKNRKVHKLSVRDEIDIGNVVPKNIVEFYQHAFNELYKIKAQDNLIDNSYRDIHRVLQLVHDPLGIKKVLLNTVDIIIRNDTSYASLTYPRKIDDRDYMNKKRNLWNHPCDKREVYTDSFYDIYDRAVLQSREMIRGIIFFLEGKITLEDLKKLFLNISYSTGKPISEKCQLKYFDPIF